MDDAPKAKLEEIKAKSEALLTKTKAVIEKADTKIKENTSDQQSALTGEQKIQNAQELKTVQQDLQKTSDQLTQQRAEITTELQNTERELTQTNNTLLEKQQALRDAADDAAKQSLQQEITQLTDRRDRLSEQKEQLTELRTRTDDALKQVSERKKPIDELVKKTEADLNTSKQVISRRSGHAARVLFAPIRLGFRTAKDAAHKVNPLDKKVNKRDTADHGIETLRLANSSIKTVHSTVKTAVRTTKTVAALPKNAVMVVRGAVVNTYRITKTVVKTTAALLIHAAAFLMNPITLLLAFVIVIGVLTSAFVAEIANLDGTEQTETIAMAYSDAAGIGDIEEKYPEAAEFYRIACDGNRAAFEAKINSLYYSNANLKNSDLVYMERNLNGTKKQFNKGFPTNDYKNLLKADWKILISEKEAVAIAYVYLEMQENTNKGTEMGIYDVAFTQDVFDLIVDTAVVWNDTTYARQECPDANCSLHNDSEPNPEYTAAFNAYNQAVKAKSDWNNNVKPTSDAYITALNAYNVILATYNTTPAAGKPFVEAALNAARDTMNTALDMFKTAVRNWCTTYHHASLTVDNKLDAKMQTELTNAVNAAKTKLDHTEQYTSSSYRTCDHLHTLHSIGLYGYIKDTVMNTLGFTDNYKEWEAMTEFGLNSNPNL